MTARMIAKKNAAQNPLTENPGTISAAIIIKSALTMREKIPSVMMFTGSVSTEMTGLINTFISPITSAARNAPVSVESTPGIKYAKSTMNKAETVQ